MAYGPILPALQRQAQRGEPTPALDRRPELYEDLQDVWAAFVQLCETRPCGFGPGAIPFQEIEAWFRLHEPGGWDKQEFAYLIRALDRAWLKGQEQHGKTEPHR